MLQTDGICDVLFPLEYITMMDNRKDGTQITQYTISTPSISYTVWSGHVRTIVTVIDTCARLPLESHRSRVRAHFVTND